MGERGGSLTGAPVRGAVTGALALAVCTAVFVAAGWPQGATSADLAEALGSMVGRAPAVDAGVLLRERLGLVAALALGGALLAPSRRERGGDRGGRSLELALVGAVAGLAIGGLLDARLLERAGAPFAPWRGPGPWAFAGTILGAWLAARGAVSPQAVALAGLLAVGAAVTLWPGGTIERDAAWRFALLGGSDAPRGAGWGALALAALARAAPWPVLARAGAAAGRVAALGPAFGLPTALASLRIGTLGGAATAVGLAALLDVTLGPARAAPGLAFAAAGALCAALSGRMASADSAR